MNKINVKYANSQYNPWNPNEKLFNYILWSIKNGEEKLWNSSKLHQEYLNKGGTESKVSRLIEKIDKQMKDELYCLKTAGMATINMHKQKKIFHV